MALPPTAAERAQVRERKEGSTCARSPEVRMMEIRDVAPTDLDALLALYRHLHDADDPLPARDVVEGVWREIYKVMLLTGRKDAATLRFYEGAGFDRHGKQAFIAKPG